MRRLALVVAYDGTAFHGWQRQPGLRTVQGELEAVLSRLLNEETALAGAGRTDAGVHARGQVASFATGSPLPARAIRARAARALPDDLRIVEAREVADAFDARRTATGRRYAYRLLRAPDVLMERHAHRVRVPWRPDAWQRATRALEGEHDFASFESTGSPRRSTVCRLMRASWSPVEGGARFDVVADHFLYHMVRNIVGSAFQAARAGEPASAMRAMLEARDRAAAGPCAPAAGLTLEQVFYPRGVWT